MISQFLLARTRGLPIASQVESRRAFPRLRTNERAIAVAGLISERIDILTAEDEAAPGIYSLLENSLELLDQGSPPERVQLVFDVLLLRETGFRPGYQSCLECGEPLSPVLNAFDLERGGFVCDKCSAYVARGRPVPVEVQKILRMIDRGDIGQVLGLRVDPALVRQANTLISDYISSLTGRESTASRVIHDLRLEYSYQDNGTEPEDDDELSG